MLTLDSQALASPCGGFGTRQENPDGSLTDDSIYAEIGGWDPGLGECPGPDDPSPYGFADRFHTRDHLGSLRAASDEAGWSAAGDRRDHYPFGLEIDPAGSDPAASRRRFTGHERDAKSGLDYMLARYYAPRFSRFASVDSGRDVQTSEAQSWNLFSYVRNRPLIGVDPDGMRIFYKPNSGDKRNDRKLIRQMKRAMRVLRRASKALRRLYRQLKRSDNLIVITMPSSMRGLGDQNATLAINQADARNGVGTGSVIAFNPNNSVGPDGSSRDPAVGLAHELQHAADNDRGISDGSPEPGSDGVPRSEARAVRRENQVRAAVGDPIRTTCCDGKAVPDPLGSVAQPQGPVAK